MLEFMKIKKVEVFEYEPYGDQEFDYLSHQKVIPHLNKLAYLDKNQYQKFPYQTKAIYEYTKLKKAAKDNLYNKHIAKIGNQGINTKYSLIATNKFDFLQPEKNRLMHRNTPAEETDKNQYIYPTYLDNTLDKYI